MKTRYLLTVTNPDDIDPENCDDQLEYCRVFVSKAKALKAFETMNTNMHVYLLEIDLVTHRQGRLK
jgi:hypothetical protein